MNNKISKTTFIKWTGSKRKQALEIVNKFPKEINTYYECFLGGGSVLHELLNRIHLGEIKCNKIICCDLNKDLINVFNIFKNKETRQKLFEYYSNLHYQLKNLADIENTPDLSEQVKKCQVLYYQQRDKLNSLDFDNPERPYIFYWITRTSFNGLIRYNPRGKFNSPFHVAGRFGIKPEELQSVFESWGNVMDNIDIEFICDSYDNVIKDAKEGDVIYMDPPYENTTGMYFCDTFDNKHMYDIMNELTNKNVKWLLSYDGKTGDDDRTANVPNNLYKQHLYINSGHSSFKKLKSKSRGIGDKDTVYDSLYMNYY